MHFNGTLLSISAVGGGGGEQDLGVEHEGGEEGEGRRGDLGVEHEDKRRIRSKGGTICTLQKETISLQKL